ncbi:hypothetical protein FDO65_20725 [Nakamurella flava]|uniref:Uncharacterized protein n=1 Tax=Nakamurella flava TaxID=2576308 RepID=A0A4V6CR76_9ACTN|nr:hypothetical protein FDO65_20725 [Nakamurella flava]
MGTPGQIVWFGVMTCIWTFITVDNLVTWHRPRDYWFIGVQALLWVVVIVNIVAWFTRREVIRRPEVPMNRTGKAVMITGALVGTAGAVVPGLLIAERPVMALAVLVVGVASGAALIAWSRRIVHRTQRWASSTGNARLGGGTRATVRRGRPVVNP